MSPARSCGAATRDKEEQHDKQFATLKARAALRGWQLWRSDPADGGACYLATRWGMTRTMGNLAEVEAFLGQAGA